MSKAAVAHAAPRSCAYLMGHSAIERLGRAITRHVAGLTHGWRDRQLRATPRVVDLRLGQFPFAATWPAGPTATRTPAARAAVRSVSAPPGARSTATRATEVLWPVRTRHPAGGPVTPPHPPPHRPRIRRDARARQRARRAAGRPGSGGHPGCPPLQCCRRWSPGSMACAFRAVTASDVANGCRSPELQVAFTTIALPGPGRGAPDPPTESGSDRRPAATAPVTTAKGRRKGVDGLPRPARHPPGQGCRRRLPADLR
jgi:hypothetical protein